MLQVKEKVNDNFINLEAGINLCQNISYRIGNWSLSTRFILTVWCTFVYSFHLIALCVLLIRYHKLLLYLGISPAACKNLKVQQFCKTVSGFSLEYKVMRERILYQRALQTKKAREKQQRSQQQRKAIVDVCIYSLFLTTSEY